MRATQADFEGQVALARQVVAAMRASFDGHGRAEALRTALADRVKALEGLKKQKAALASANDLSAKIAAVEGVPTRGFGGFGGGRPTPSFRRINGDLGGLLTSVDQADGRADRRDDDRVPRLLPRPLDGRVAVGSSRRRTCPR